MKLKEWLDQWGMKSLKIKSFFLEMEWAPNDVDKDAAWELYVELLTRSTTQKIRLEDGDEKAALFSVFNIFNTTREIIKTKGRHCINFTKLAVVVLNQVIRPFSTRWHKRMLAGAFDDSEGCAAFRQELADLQEVLTTYTRMLADMADVEDLTALEEK